MAYRLKTIQYQGRECQILLQNENGPCPLLAAANALLLLDKVNLPSAAVRNNVASLSDLTNVLANFALPNTGEAFYLDELLQHIPKLQDGMDINPKFTSGVTGYEFTSQMTCFDLWRVKLVHGWLMDPHETDETLYQAVESKTYNELIECVVKGSDADTALNGINERLRVLNSKRSEQSFDLLGNQGPSTELDSLNSEIQELETQREKLTQESTIGSWVENFLRETGHQLTPYGLQTLHEQLSAEEVTVFFRNNHFSTMVKHEGQLYLLVTDLGYANTPMVVWERLDVIDGDTDYVNSQFKAPGQIQTTGSSLTPEQLIAQSSQNDADYHMALHLSTQSSNAERAMDSEEGKLIAAATEASLREYHGVSSPLGTTIAGIPEGAQIEVGIPVGFNAAAQTNPGMSPQEVADHLLAMQLVSEQDPTAPNPSQTTEDASWRLARQLQDEENMRSAAERRTVQQRAAATTSPSSSSSSGNGKCVIS